MTASHVAKVALCLCVLFALERVVRLVRAFSAAHRRQRLPVTAILVLGGDLERERAAARLCGGRGDARSGCWSDANVPLLVSSAHAGAEGLFLSCGVAERRLLVDDSAFDTLSNYTTALKLLPPGSRTHVAVLTSGYHARRAAVLAALVLGSCGTACTVTAVQHAGPASAGEDETARRRWRDALRGALWALTGVDAGEAVGRYVHPERFYHMDARAQPRGAGAGVWTAALCAGLHRLRGRLRRLVSAE